MINSWGSDRYKGIKKYFGTNPSPLIGVTFKHSKRGPLSKYEDYFNVPIKFEDKYNALIFDRKLLSLPSLKAETTATSILIQQIDELRKKKGLPDFDQLSQINKTVKLNCLAGDFSVDGLAHKLAMSPRNLQRHLKTKGISARTLIDETRYKLSLELLTDKRNSIAHITEKLGYSSERGFREAFKKWSGEYPAQIRKDISQD